MRVSARCGYACRALLELSLHWPDKEPLQIQEIAEKQGIPTRYLVQILIQLKQIGLVGSVRGKQGGYNLKVPPGQITLGSVVREIGGPVLQVAEAVSGSKKPNAFSSIWEEVEGAISKIVDDVTFQDICDRAKEVEKNVIYQI